MIGRYLNLRKSLYRFQLKQRMKRLAKEHKKLAERSDRLLSRGELAGYRSCQEKTTQIQQEIKVLLSQCLAESN